MGTDRNYHIDSGEEEEVRKTGRQRCPGRVKDGDWEEGSGEEGSLLPAQRAGSLKPHIRVGERRNRQGRGGCSAKICLVTCCMGSLW